MAYRLQLAIYVLKRYCVPMQDSYGDMKQLVSSKTGETESLQQWVTLPTEPITIL